MNINDLVIFKWIGYKKNTQKGSFCGFFIEGNNQEHSEPWHCEPLVCTYFWGRVNKTIDFSEEDISEEFINFIESKRMNYRDIEYDKMLSIYPKLEQEIEMFLAMKRLKGNV
jgi:hypothetical protein